MPRRQRPPVEREGAHFRINIGRDERELIRRLMAEMRSLLTESTDDDGRMKRIFPAAYHQEGDRAFNDEYQRLMREEILTSRLKGLDAVDSFMAQASGDRAMLTESEMMAFLQALNGIRLVLGTMLDITDDDHELAFDPNDPNARTVALYGYLGGLLDEIVDAQLAD